MYIWKEFISHQYELFVELKNVGLRVDWDVNCWKITMFMKDWVVLLSHSINGLAYYATYMELVVQNIFLSRQSIK